MNLLAYSWKQSCYVARLAWVKLRLPSAGIPHMYDHTWLGIIYLNTNSDHRLKKEVSMEIKTRIILPKERKPQQ